MTVLCVAGISTELKLQQDRSWWGYCETLPSRKSNEASDDATKEGIEAPFPMVIKNRLGKPFYSVAYAEIIMT